MAITPGSQWSQLVVIIINNKNILSFENLSDPKGRPVLCSLSGFLNLWSVRWLTDWLTEWPTAVKALYSYADYYFKQYFQYSETPLETWPAYCFLWSNDVSLALTSDWRKQNLVFSFPSPWYYRMYYVIRTILALWMFPIYRGGECHDSGELSAPGLLDINILKINIKNS